MRRVTGVRLALSILLALVLASSGASAQLFVATGRDTLRGLPGIEVLIEPLQPELERVGLTAASIAAAVTQQLKAASVTIYVSQRENAGLSKPYLYVHVNAASEQGGTYAVATQVQLRQTLASLTTESRIVNAMSWDAHGVSIIPAVQLQENVSAEIQSLVKRFIADWRSVH